MPFAFAKGHLSLAGQYFCDFAFCQESSSCHLWLQFIRVLRILKILKLWWGRWWCWTNCVIIWIWLFVQNFLKHNLFHRGITFENSKRSRSFCDSPRAMDFVDEDELFSCLTSLLIGVDGAFALLSNKCRLWRVNLRLPCLQKCSTFSLPHSLVLNSGHHLTL